MIIKAKRKSSKDMGRTISVIGLYGLTEKILSGGSKTCPPVKENFYSDKIKVSYGI